MIKNILFDLDGTLFSFDECEAAALKSALKVYTRDLDSNQLNVYRKINSELWALFEKGLVDKETVLRKRFEEFLDKINLRVSPSQFNELYLYFLGGNFCLEFGALEILLKLRKEYKLYVVTNGVETVQIKKIVGANLIDFFEDIFISENIGVSKPDKAYFEYCLKKMGCDASECMIVGDSLLSDILGGNNTDMVTCWYNPKGKINDTGIIPDYEINNLEQVNNILESLLQMRSLKSQKNAIYQ